MRSKPVVRPLGSRSSLKSAYELGVRTGPILMFALAALEPGAVAEGWQRHYLRGETADRRKIRLPCCKRNSKCHSRQGKIRRTLSLLGQSQEAPSNRGGAPRRGSIFMRAGKRHNMVWGSGARLRQRVMKHFRFVPFLLPIGLQEFSWQRPQMARLRRAITQTHRKSEIRCRLRRPFTR